MNSQSQQSTTWKKLRAIVASVLLLLSAMPRGEVFAADSGRNDEYELHGAITKLPGTANFVGDWTVGDRSAAVPAVSARWSMVRAGVRVMRTPSRLAPPRSH